MVRLAQEQDISTLAQLVHSVKLTSGWRDESDAYNDDTLGVFIDQRLHDPLSVCYVWQPHDGVPTALCGVTLQRLFHPPYMPIVFEWGWAGPKRQAVSCWRVCTQWAKKRGAIYAHRVTAASAVHPRRITETVTWEKL